MQRPQPERTTMTYPRPVSHALGVVLLVSGCDLRVDASLIADDERDGGRPSFDAGRSPDEDASSLREDAGVVHVPGADAGSFVCSHDVECAALSNDTQYCSKVLERCVDRCTPEGLCAGPFDSEPTGLGADESGVVWSTETPSDPFGTPIDGAELWRWDGESPAQRILAEARHIQTALVKDGAVYFHAPAGFMRLADASRAPERLSATAAHVWSTSSDVWWSVKTDGGSELWKRPRRSDASPERMATAAHDGWTAGNSSHVFRPAELPDGDFSFAVLRAAHDELTAESPFVQADSLDGYYFGLIASESGLFYTNMLSGITHRGGFTFQPFADELPAFAAGPLAYTVGDWAYTLHCEPGEARKFERFHTSKQFGKETLLELPAAPAEAQCWGWVAASGDKLFFFDTLEGRLFAKSIPPLRCSAEIACPDGQSCLSNQTCQ
jgi:hypothetical protein